MTKTIGIELSKKLSDKGLLDNMETEYSFYTNELEDRVNYAYNRFDLAVNKKAKIRQEYICKTLILEEVIELIGKDMCNMSLLYPNAGKWFIELQFEKDALEGNSLIEVFEKFLEYCLDNDLLRDE